MVLVEMLGVKWDEEEVRCVLPNLPTPNIPARGNALGRPSVTSAKPDMERGGKGKHSTPR